MSFLLWQLIDSGFPAGGFAHSGGLEASMQHGRVADATGVHAFAQQALLQAGRGSLPLMSAAHRDPNALGELDRLSHIFLSNSIANRASRAQGRALLSSVARSFPHAHLASIEERVHAERLCCHHAPLFGAALETLGVDLLASQRAFLFIGVRGISLAAVRLGLIGAYEAQALQTLLSPDIERTIARCGSLPPAAIAQTAPLADLCQATHDRLYSRLFQS